MNYLKPKYWSKKNSFISKFLLPISLIYQIFLFIKQKFTIKEDFNLPIICVGNIYLGGTGKTPLSIEIYKELEKKKFKPVLIKKFYPEHFDEQQLIKDRDVNIILEKNRKKGVLEAIEKKFNVAILDDGFQDLSVNKSINIICFNSEQQIGNGYVIPSGPLRERFESIKDVKIVVINGKKNIDFENKILNINNKIKIFYTKYIPLNLEKIKNKKLLAVAGIGEPKNFFNLLEKNNLNIPIKMEFPDHYNFKKKDVDKIQEIATKNHLHIVTTEKDYYRLDKSFKDNIHYVKVELDIEKKEKFINLVIEHSVL